MKQYERYKESGVEWLGRVPEHWEILKMKYAFNERVQKGFPNEPLLSSTQNRGVILQQLYENRTVVATKDLDKLKLVEVDDFVISLRSFQGGLEYAYFRGIISPAYMVLTPVNIEPEYFRFLGKSNIYIQLLKSCVTGIREGQNIDYNILKENYIPVPSIEEQRAIAYMLDQKCAQIDKAISQKERVIDLLNERRQIIIQRAVTRGLDPNVPMKDISKSWAKKIPLHWNYREIGRIAKITTGSTPPTNQEFYFNSGDINWYTPSDITENIVEVVESMRKLSYKAEENGLISLYPKGVVLLIGIGGTLGRVGYSESTCYSNQQINAIIFNNNHLSRFFVYQLKVLSSYIWANANIATIPILNQAATKRLFVCIPPYDEQQQIATYLDNINAKIDKAIALKRQEIEKLKEYKTVLIDAAVTGKIKIA